MPGNNVRRKYIVELCLKERFRTIPITFNILCHCRNSIHHAVVLFIQGQGLNRKKKGEKELKQTLGN